MLILLLFNYNNPFDPGCIMFHTVLHTSNTCILYVTNKRNLFSMTFRTLFVSRRTHPFADAMEADNEGKAISLSISGVFDLPIVAGPLLPGAL